MKSIFFLWFLELTVEVFQELLGKKLTEEQMTQAIQLFEGGGNQPLTLAITNALMQVADKDKVDEVLQIIQKHFSDHLVYQHPEIRGQIVKFGGNPTDVLFLHIYEDVLELTPTQ